MILCILQAPGTVGLVQGKVNVATYGLALSRANYEHAMITIGTFRRPANHNYCTHVSTFVAICLKSRKDSELRALYDVLEIQIRNL